MAEDQKPKRIYPFKIRPLDADAKRRQAALFTGHPNGLVSTNHWGFKVAGTCTEQELTATYNSSLDPKDIWLVSPPKCGSLWTLEMIWLLANDLDYARAKTPLVVDRSTFTDWTFVHDKEWAKAFEENVRQERPDLLETGSDGWLTGKIDTTSTSLFKTHLPFSVNNPDLLDTCKVFFVARNIKDTCLSWYKFSRLVKSLDFCGNLGEFCNMFMADEVLFAPIIPTISEAWNLRHHPNLCMLFYEDAKKDLRSYLKKIAGFLEKSYTDEEFAKLEDYLHIDNFRKNPYVNQAGGYTEVLYNKHEHGSFVRKGVVGDWYNHCTPDIDAKFDKWLNEQLKGVDPDLAKKLQF